MKAHFTLGPKVNCHVRSGYLFVVVNSLFGLCLRFLVAVCISKGVVSVDVSLSLWCEAVAVRLRRLVNGMCSGEDCLSGLISNGVVSVVASVSSLVMSVSVLSRVMSVITQSLSSLVESLSCERSVSGT